MCVPLVFPLAGLECCSDRLWREVPQARPESSGGVSYASLERWSTLPGHSLIQEGDCCGGRCCKRGCGAAVQHLCDSTTVHLTRLGVLSVWLPCLTTSCHLMSCPQELGVQRHRWMRQFRREKWAPHMAPVCIGTDGGIAKPLVSTVHLAPEVRRLLSLLANLLATHNCGHW